MRYDPEPPFPSTLACGPAASGFVRGEGRERDCGSDRPLPDLQKWSFGHSKLTSDEARRIAGAIARIPEFMLGRRGFFVRGPGSYRWSMARPFHVAFKDSYIRTNWD